MSLVGFHNISKEFIPAEHLVNNPEWMNKKDDEWLMPESEILNLTEIRQKGIIPFCTFIDGYKRKDDTPVRAHFRIKDNKVKTYDRENESEEHRLAKEEIYYKIYDNAISFDIGGKEYYPKDLGGFKVFIEKGVGSKRADVLLLLDKEHPIIGNGIVVEVQLSRQTFDKTDLRSYDRALQGYSCVWLFENNFNDDGIINTRLKVKIFRELLDKYSEIVSNRDAEKISVYSSFLNKVIEDYSITLNEIESKLSYIKRYTEDKLNNFNEQIENEIVKDLQPIKEVVKEEMKSEFENNSNTLRKLANENLQLAEEKIKEQNKLLEEKYAEAIDNLKVNSMDKMKNELKELSKNIEKKLFDEGLFEQYVSDRLNEIVNEKIDINYNKITEDLKQKIENKSSEIVKNTAEKISKDFIENHVNIEIENLDKKVDNKIDGSIKEIIEDKLDKEGFKSSFEKRANARISSVGEEISTWLPELKKMAIQFLKNKVNEVVDETKRES